MKNEMVTVKNEEFPDHRAVLLDKGFYGIQRDKRAIMPKEKLAKPFVLQAEKRRNDLVSVDSVIVEKYFGREVLWKIFDRKFRISED